MIKSITIGNFLSFKDKNTLSLLANDSLSGHKSNTFIKTKERYLKVIGLFGPNAAGKSSFLKGILFFRQFILTSYIASLSSNQIPVKPYELSEHTRNKPSFFEIELGIKKKTYKYGFEVSRDKVENEWLIENPYNKKLFSRNGNKITKNSRFKEYALISKKSIKDNVLILSLLAQDGGHIANELIKEIQKIEVVLDKGGVLNYTIKSFTENPVYSKLIKEFVAEADVSISDIKAIHEAVTWEEFMQKVPPMFRGTVGSTGNYFRQQLTTSHDIFDEDNKIVDSVDFDFFRDESYGTQQFVALSGAIINAILEGKTLFIDELDASLHPYLTKFIIKKFLNTKYNTQKGQLVFTTHDTNLLDKDLLRTDQIVLVEKGKYGSSEMYSLADLGERKDRNFQSRYLEGRYGALPFILDIEKDK